jgi:heptosyltransferase-1
VVEPRWAPLLTGGGLVDRIVEFHRHDPATWAGTRTELLGEKYHLAVDFQGSVKSALVARAAGPRQLFGYGAGIARERPASWFYSRPVRTNAKHVVVQGLDLAAAAGASARVEDFPLPEGAPEGSLPNEPFVLASPLAGWTSKQWPMEYFAQLARLLRMPLVVNGAPGAVPDIPGTWKHESGIAGLIHATRKAALVVGVDSGPLHLAAALGKPGVAIFGPTDPERNGPRGGDFTVFRQAGAATTHRRGTEIAASMRAISPEMILHALESRIACRA